MAEETKDPYAKFGAPVNSAEPTPNASTNASDPYAKFGKPVQNTEQASPDKPAEQDDERIMGATGFEGYGGEGVDDITKGVAKGAGQTVNTVSKLINKIPGVGETLAPKAGIDAADKMNTATNFPQKVGMGAEMIAEFFLGDEALKAISVAERLKLASQVVKVAESHPIVARILGIGMNALRQGTVGTAQAKMHGASNEEALKTGAMTAATGAVLEGATSAAEGTAGYLASKRPYAKSIAGVDVPTSQPHTAGDVTPMGVTKPAIEAPKTTAPEAQNFIDNYVQPKAVEATTANLADSSIEQAAKLRDLRGEAPFPYKGSIHTPEDAANLLKTEAQKTYKTLDDVAKPDIDKWEADYQAFQDSHPEPVARPKSSPSTSGETTGERTAMSDAAKSEKTAWKDADKAWLADNPKPRTFQEIQSDLINAQHIVKRKGTLPVDRQTAMDALKGYKEEAKDFLDKYGHSIDPNELSMANKVYSRYMQMSWLNDRLITAIKGTEGTPSTLVPSRTNVSVSRLEGIQGSFDKEYGTGSFAELLGKDGINNWNEVINMLQNPVSGKTPLMEWLTAMKPENMVSGAYHVGKQPYDYVVGKLLFDPEYGRTAIAAYRKVMGVANAVRKVAPATVPAATHRYNPDKDTVEPIE